MAHICWCLIQSFTHSFIDQIGIGAPENLHGTIWVTRDLTQVPSLQQVIFQSGETQSTRHRLMVQSIRWQMRTVEGGGECKCGLTRQQGRQGGRGGNTWIFERRLFQAKEKSWHVQGTAKSQRGWSEWGRERGDWGGGEGGGWEGPRVPGGPF